MKILLVEDDQLIQKMLEMKLKSEGYEIMIASNGREALEILKANSINLIVTDIMMPFVGGIEFINIVRNELKDNTPIIILSSLMHEETILKAFDLGVDDYITKPFSPKELSIRIKRFIKPK